MTYFNWKKRFGGLLPDAMRRLKTLEDENSRLKKIVLRDSTSGTPQPPMPVATQKPQPA